MTDPILRRGATLLLRAAALLAFAFAAPAMAQLQPLRISQVYGGGGQPGAALRHDFVELFNAGEGAVSLDGMFLHVSASGSTTWLPAAALGGSLEPGQYLMVRFAAGAETSMPALDTYDLSTSVNLAANAGKIALTATAARPSGCAYTAVSFVSYGTTNCPSGAAPALTAETSAQRRDDGCYASTSNAFQALAPNPRSRATPRRYCGGSYGTAGSLHVAWTQRLRGMRGDSVLLAAAVAPAEDPASTNIVVLLDDYYLGGTPGESLRLRDDGTGGDAVAGDRVFSARATLPVSTPPGQLELPIGVGDAQGRTSNGWIVIDVEAGIAIHGIQGSGGYSPVAYTFVTTEGIVTARMARGFYLQARDAAVDADPLTSEGIFVHTGNPVPADAAVGNHLSVYGKIAETVFGDVHYPEPSTIFYEPTLTVLATAQPLPTPVTLTKDLLDNDAWDRLERVEGMRVRVERLEVVGPVGATLDDAQATAAIDGRFHGTLPGVARPFAEPGIDVRFENYDIPEDSKPPQWDGNPELLLVDSRGQEGASALGAEAGDAVTGLVGVIDAAEGNYRLLPDADADVVVVPGTSPLRAAATPDAREVTIAHLDLQRFYDDVDAAGIAEPVLGAAALTRRLRKTANAICAYLHAPDILAVAGAENLAVLQRLADAVNAGDTSPDACAGNPQYVALLLEGDDPAGLDVGFLVRTDDVGGGTARVEVLALEQLGRTATLARPYGGTTERLFDHPSLLARLRVHHANGLVNDFTVIASDLAPREDLDNDEHDTHWSNIGKHVGNLRVAQARFLADVVQARQVADPTEALVLVGGFHAFAFNDGYADVMGILGGNAAAKAEVVFWRASPIAPALVNPFELLPEAERYSHTDEGNAQLLGHVLLGDRVVRSFAARLDHARINADFGADNFGDEAVPVRVSDHDPLVLYLRDGSYDQVDLAVAIDTDIVDPQAGDWIGFGVGIANGGPGDAPSAHLQLTLDAPGVGFHAGSPAWDCEPAKAQGDGQVIHCTATGAIANGTSTSLAVYAEVPAPGGEPITLGAVVTAGAVDRAHGNDAASRTVATIGAVDLAVAVVPPASEVLVGDTAVFGVGVGNASDDAARDVELTLAQYPAVAGVQVDVPAGWTCDAPVLVATQNRIDCRTATMAHASQAGFVVRVPATAALEGQELHVAASVYSVVADPLPDNNSDDQSVQVKAPVDLEIEVDAPNGKVVATGRAMFRVYAHNIGEATARDVVVGINLNLPASRVSVSAPDWNCVSIPVGPQVGAWTCTRATLAPGDGNEGFMVSAQPFASKTGQLTLVARIHSASSDPNPANDTSKGSVRVVAK
jgi:predicted extracellular nuclease